MFTATEIHDLSIYHNEHFSNGEHIVYTNSGLGLTSAIYESLAYSLFHLWYKLYIFYSYLLYYIYYIFFYTHLDEFACDHFNDYLKKKYIGLALPALAIAIATCIYAAMSANTNLGISLK